MDVKVMVKDTIDTLWVAGYIGGVTSDGVFTGRCKLTMNFPSVTRF